MHATTSDAHFAGYPAFYSDCSYKYLDDEGMAAQPVCVFHGMADDNTNPIALCRAYERLKSRQG
ncbi:hypothetical protein CA603_17275 [Paraburkholderia hospita]|nr:hypothetical protein CA603_17275 [Paraburkholderia hospita]